MEMRYEHDLAGEASALGTLSETGFPEATPEEINQACRAANSALQPYRLCAPESRAEFLEQIAMEIESELDLLILTIPAETALPEARVRGELARTCGQLRLFADVVRQGDYLGVRIDHAQVQHQPPRSDLRQYRIPIGPVAVFGSSNFPLAFSVAGGDTASALAAGCTVVVKAHPGHPRTSKIVGEALRRAIRKTDMPSGVFSMLFGESHSVGGTLVEHAAIKAVAFTGSFAGGTALARVAQARAEPIPVYAEMGSVNPVFFLPGALARDPDGLALAYFGSLTMGVGQFCTNPGLVFAVRGLALEQFCTALERVARNHVPQKMLNPGILSAYRLGVERLEAVDGVIKAAIGQDEQALARVQIFRVDAATFKTNPRLAEEVFGPTGLLVELDDLEQMESVAQTLPGQLTATLHGEAHELERQQPLVRTLERRVGRVLFNGFPTGVEVCHAMVHGGPWPATTAVQTTSVGSLAIERFLRPVCFQDCPDGLLPEALKEGNPFGLRRLIDGRWHSGNS